MQQKLLPVTRISLAMLILSITAYAQNFLTKAIDYKIMESPLHTDTIEVLDSASKTHIYIFGIGKRMSTWKYKFTINGNTQTLKPGHCMEYIANGDSIKIEILNKPFLKTQLPINLYASAKKDVYLYLTTEEPFDKFPFTTMAVKEICKECYEKLAAKCK